MNQVILITDGACIGNPGPGGWACILRYGDHQRKLSGSEPITTNNRMELQAVIGGLSALKKPCHVTVYSDSKYVIDGITSWVRKWKSSGWVRKVRGGRQPVKNQDLWMELDALSSLHTIEWKWVKGHADHADNNECDRLANHAAISEKRTRLKTMRTSAMLQP